jgi:hypothetical protein
MIRINLKFNFYVLGAKFNPTLGELHRANFLMLPLEERERNLGVVVIDTTLEGGRKQ